MTTEHFPCIKINAPAWFEREDFRTFLNSGAVATWHKTGSEPDEMSDVFVTYDSGDGSNSPRFVEPTNEVIPEDIWDEIDTRMKEERVSYALLWITNLEE